MKIKTIESWKGSKDFDLKVNEFISNGQINVLNIQFSSNWFYLYAMIQYEEQ